MLLFLPLSVLDIGLFDFAIVLDLMSKFILLSFFPVPHSLAPLPLLLSFSVIFSPLCPPSPIHLLVLKLQFSVALSLTSLFSWTTTILPKGHLLMYQNYLEKK